LTSAKNSGRSATSRSIWSMLTRYKARR
jgi:hypothetical protein